MFINIVSLLVLFFSVCYTHTDMQVSFLLHKDQQHINDVINNMFRDPVHIDRITFESDVYMSPREFSYLVDIYDDQMVAADDIAKAIYFLDKKNSFESVSVSLLDTDNLKTLHFTLASAWTVSKIRVNGILRGSQEYKRLYELELGDQFDETKHLHSCKKIREYLAAQGYHKAVVNDEYVRVAKTKTVEVTLSVARATRYRIADVIVNVEKNNHNQHVAVLANDLQKRFFRQLHGQWHTRDSISYVTASCKKYILHAGFLSSDIVLQQRFDHRRKKVVLTFKVDVLHHKQLFFEGNTFFSQVELLDRIAQFGKSVWLLPTELLSEELERMYKEKGFWQVSIQTIQNQNSITFVVSEGKRARIDHVRLTSNQLIDEQKVLRKFFRDAIHTYVDVPKIETIFYNFVAHYVDQGYTKAQVVDYTYQEMSDGKYELVVAFDKGEPTIIANITIKGLEKEDMLEAILPSDDGYLLTREFISNQQATLLQYCKDKGYLYAQATPRIFIDEDNKTILEWNVQTGQKIFFGKTVVVGRPEFPFEKIEKRLCFSQGQLWDRTLVQRSLQHLKDTNIFQIVQLYPDQVSHGEDKLLLLRLQHDDPFELRLRGGFELEHIKDYQTFGGVTYKVGGTAMMKNPLRIGDVFRFDTDISGRHREITGQYTVPIDIGGISVLQMQAYHILFEHPGFIGSRKNIYTVYQNGILSGLQKKIGYTDLGCTIGIEWQKTEINDIARADTLADAIGFDKNTLNKQVPYLFFEPTVYIDVLDDPIAPHKGLYTLFSLKGMAPLKERGASELFLKFHAEQAFFIPLYSAVLAARFRFGHIFYHDFSGINPIERFYLGGSHSIRGYEGDLVPPLKEFIDEDGDTCLIPRGGKSMANVNIEMRFNLFENIGAVLFHDVGTLSIANFTDHDNFIAHASGFGIRFHTPLGPLRFDMGFKWNRLFEQERRYAWYVTFGQAF